MRKQLLLLLSRCRHISHGGRVGLYSHCTNNGKGVIMAQCRHYARSVTEASSPSPSSSNPHALRSTAAQIYRTVQVYSRGVMIHDNKNSLGRQSSILFIAFFVAQALYFIYQHHRVPSEDTVDQLLQELEQHEKGGSIKDIVDTVDAICQHVKSHSANEVKLFTSRRDWFEKLLQRVQSGNIAVREPVLDLLNHLTRDTTLARELSTKWPIVDIMSRALQTNIKNMKEVEQERTNIVERESEADSKEKMNAKFFGAVLIIQSTKCIAERSTIANILANISNDQRNHDLLLNDEFLNMMEELTRRSVNQIGVEGYEQSIQHHVASILGNMAQSPSTMELILQSNGAHRLTTGEQHTNSDTKKSSWFPRLWRSKTNEQEDSNQCLTRLLKIAYLISQSREQWTSKRTHEVMEALLRLHNGDNVEDVMREIRAIDSKIDTIGLAANGILYPMTGFFYGFLRYYFSVDNKLAIKLGNGAIMRASLHCAAFVTLLGIGDLALERFKRHTRRQKLDSMGAWISQHTRERQIEVTAQVLGTVLTALTLQRISFVVFPFLLSHYLHAVKDIGSSVALSIPGSWSDIAHHKGYIGKKMAVKEVEVKHE